MHEIEGKEGVDVGGGEEALVAIAGEVAVGGHVVAAGAGAIGAVLLGIEHGSARIVRELAGVTDAEVAGAWVVAAIAAVVAGAGVDAARAVAFFPRCLVCGVAAGAMVAFLRDLCLRLCDRVRIVNFYA